MKLTKKQIKRIENFAFNYYRKQDFAHNIEHALRTVKLAEFLAKKEKADIQLCRIGALLHQFHDNSKAVEELLRKINIDKVSKEQILDCVRHIRRRTVNKAKSLEAKIVFDADKLQSLGPLGIYRQFAYLSEVKKLGLNKVKETKRIQEDIYKKLQTKTVKKLAKEPHKLAVKFFETLEKWLK